MLFKVAYWRFCQNQKLIPLIIFITFCISAWFLFYGEVVILPQRQKIYSNNPYSHNSNITQKDIQHESFKFRYLPKIVKEEGDSFMSGQMNKESALELMLSAELESKYYNLAQHDDGICKGLWMRLGGQTEGGWDVCLADMWKLQKGSCLIYSFGIGSLWNFVETLSDELGLYQCQVRAFDPSISDESALRTKPFHNLHFYKLGIGGSNVKRIMHPQKWRLMTFSKFLLRFKEENHTIDVLKLDVEFSEWSSLAAAMHHGVLNRVKQIMFESHTRDLYSINQRTSAIWFKRFCQVLQGLRKAGFRQWRHTANSHGLYQSRNTGQVRPCCFQHYFLNIGFQQPT